MEFLTELYATSPHLVWYGIGAVFLIVEAVFLGLSTLALLFLGIGALVTGLGVHIGYIPSMEGQLTTFSLATAASALLLWKPFKAWQNNVREDRSSDMIGMQVELSEAIRTGQPGKVRWSGVDWKARLDQESGCTELASGTRVVVTRVAAGEMTVKPA